jgi:hypothetical protein
MIKLLYKSALLALVFLLSPIDAAYAGLQCLLLSNDNACMHHSQVAATSACCCEKRVQTGARMTSRSTCSAKPCPLVFTLAKSFDPAVTNERSGVNHAILSFIVATPQLPALSCRSITQAAEANITPPDLNILQRNLRI